MPCPTSDVIDLWPWDAACYSTNITRANDGAYLQASEECCFAIAGTHLIINEEDCWAYCNVSTKYEGIAVGTCGNNGLNLPDDVDTSHIGGMCTFGTLPDGEDIRSLVPTSLLGSYAHPDPTDSSSNSGSAAPTAGGAETTTSTSVSGLPSPTLTGDATVKSTTETPTKSNSKADGVTSAADSSKTGLSSPSTSAPASTSASASKGTSIRMPKIALGLVALSIGAMITQS